ncbi:MAG: hypothetical protein ABIJ83_03235 [Patescibacteria group bacterium]|nr:hypothetical protein [Patescibacteria group bacterium]MBU0897830.1 hypothetical protein [Patescibacteria group bacterium]MBU1063070.1 hypothetical protein [Patescibacteria group bacterium]MBU1783445.1 hypothetical protein [Patescibacteria group bacterium]
MEFFTKYKKIFLIIGFILVVFILGYLLYSVFFKQPEAQPINIEPTATGTSAGLPTAGTGAGTIITPSETSTGLPIEPSTSNKIDSTAQGGITQTNQLSQTPSIAATLSSDGNNLQYYNQDDGKFYSITKDGQTTLLTDKVFNQVEKITWSPEKNKAILEYPDGANIVYDFTNKKQITLPTHWKDFDFSPDGSKLVMKSIGLDPNNRWLAISNEDGSKAQQLEAIGDKDETVYPSWSPNNQTVAMYTKGVDFNRQEVYFIGLNGENFKSMTIEGRGFQPKWSPSGDKLLYSVYSSNNNLKPMLWLTNASGDNIGSNRQTLNIETWANKCVFANSSDLYCAVPEKLEEGSGLFPEMAKNTKDNLYKIDVKTGLKKLIATPDGNYNMSNLIIPTNNSYLYFTDETSKELFKINLK